MKLYQIIENENLVSADLLKLMFGNYKSKYSPLQRIQSLPMVSHDVCVFYSAVIQMCVLESAKKQSKTIRTLYKGKNFGKTMIDLWHDGETDLETESNAVSFIKNAMSAMKNDGRLFGPGLYDALNQTARDYNNLMNKDVYVHDTQDHFLDLLRNLPLLREIRIADNGTAVIGNEVLVCSPFLMVRDKKLYITTSAMKGECNTQLFLNQREMNSPEAGTVLYKEFFITDSEDHSMFCQILELDVRWYDQKQYLGNCIYVVNLAEMLSFSLCKAITERYKKKGRGVPNNILSDLKYYFRYSPIYRDLEALEKKSAFSVNTYGEIFYSDNRLRTSTLSNIMMGFIIKYGAFITIHDFFFDGSSKLLREKDDRNDNYGEISSKKIFYKYSVPFIAKKYLSDEKEAWPIVKKYRQIIREHLSQLEKIVQKEDEAYLIRSDYIRAEQRTCCIIDMMGMNQENIFTNQESLLSLQDYCDMVFNKTSTPLDMMHKLTTFLVDFYGTITHKTMEIRRREKPYQYIEDFKDYCSTTLNGRMKDMTGREICDLKTLQKYIDLFDDDSIKWGIDGARRHDSLAYFFVSYCHRDLNIVSSIINKLEKKGFKFRHDGMKKGIDEQFKIGSNWKQEAQKLIFDERCQGVLLFVSKNSVCSQSVYDELVNAERRAENDNLDSDDPFIFKINLDDRVEFDWVRTFRVSDCEGMDVPDPQKAVEVAHQFGDHLNNKEIYATAATLERLSDNMMVREDNYAERTGAAIDFDSLNPSELYLLSYLYFLKSGNYRLFSTNDSDSRKAVLNLDKGLDWNGGPFSVYHCIYPLLISVKETRVKRDRVTILSYSIINGKKNSLSSDKVMLTSDNVYADDYYCIPNVHSSHECGEWISNPVLVPAKDVK